MPGQRRRPCRSSLGAEVEDAFAHFYNLGCVGRLERLGCAVHHDALYIEHFWVRCTAAEILAWINPVMSGVPRSTRP